MKKIMTKSYRIIWLLVLLVIILATSTLFGTFEGLTMSTTMTNAQNNLATAQNNLSSVQNTPQNNLASVQNTAQNNLASIQNKMASMTSGTVESFFAPRARLAVRNNAMFY